MITPKNTARLLCLAGLMSAAVGLAQAADDIEWVTTSRGRYEIAIGAHSWPGLAGLQAAQGGAFDEVGFNLNLAAHWAVKRFAGSELLAGIDLGLMSNDSNIRFVWGDVTARNGYIAPSVKWMFGRRHRYSLDAGLGYYVQDVAEVAGSYPYYWETQLWEDSTVGGYVGTTIDFRGGDPYRTHGMMASFKVHFLEFGTVQDEGPLPTTLGGDAGSLSGPVYMLQFGYRWR